MDSAVLLGGEPAAEGPPASKALHHLEASCQLLDTAAPTPTASGALDDWQVHAGPWLTSPVYSPPGASLSMCHKRSSSTVLAQPSDIACDGAADSTRQGPSADAAVHCSVIWCCGKLTAVRMRQVVSLAEIQVALAGTLKHAPGSPCSPGGGDTPRDPPLPVSPGKASGSHALLSA
jgi:hypothetical protein